jgi:hypothetical protein
MPLFIKGAGEKQSLITAGNIKIAEIIEKEPYKDANY